MFTPDRSIVKQAISPAIRERRGGALYASYLNEGIGLFKSTPPNWTLLDYYPTAFQVGQLVIASSDRRSVFVGDLRGGVSLWEFTLP